MDFLRENFALCHCAPAGMKLTCASIFANVVKSLLEAVEVTLKCETRVLFVDMHHVGKGSIVGQWVELYFTTNNQEMTVSLFNEPIQEGIGT